MATSFDSYAREATKKINEGLPLGKFDLKALSYFFIKSTYFAHVKFGLETGRIEPEELILRSPKELIKEIEFIYFVAFLIKNNLDVNYYFETSYGQKLHILIYISKLMGDSGSSSYLKYIVDLFKRSGCNLGLTAILQTSKEATRRGKTVEEELGSESKLAPNSTIDVKGETFQWDKILRPILLDNFKEKENIDISNLNDLEKMYLMNVICLSESKNIVKMLDDVCIFKNEVFNMKQSIYFSINSQNYEIFRIMLQKGLVCNYVEMSELICRHNLASSKKDNILKKAYSKMIVFAIESGAEIDNNQLRLLSIEATVELIDKIKEAYSQPEWRKLCDKTNLSDNDMSNEKIRKIAFNLNINFSLPPHKICEKLEQISNMDRLEYVRASIIRQEERVARSLIEVGDLRPEDKLEDCKCDKRTMLINNPYAYNDARMAFYKDEKDGKLWCFTSDMFENLIGSGINPYNKEKLPEMFLETITSQLNILESLDLKPDRDMKSIGETLEDIFYTKKEINSKFSDDEYYYFINKYRIITGKEETDFRNLSLRNEGTIFNDIIQTYFYYFTNCRNISSRETNPFTGKNYLVENDNPDSMTITRETMNQRQTANKIYQNVFKLFQESKFIDEIIVSKTGELYYKNLAFILTDLERKINKGKVLIKSSGASRSMEKNYYKTDSFTLLKDLYTNQLKIS